MTPSTYVSRMRKPRTPPETLTPAALRSAMAKLKFNADEVAARMGVDRRTVFRWLKGETPVPKSVTLLMWSWSTDPMQRAAILAEGNEQP